MSAYMVERHHIAYLIAAGLRFGDRHFRWRHEGAIRKIDSTDIDRLNEVGQMLWDENRKSIECRYPDTRDNFCELAPGATGENFVYIHNPEQFWHNIKPAQVINSVKCYEYQSCEHGGWHESEARAFCASLKDYAVSELIARGHGLVWGAPEPSFGVCLSSLMS